jgi:hypothetical protein
LAFLQLKRDSQMDEAMDVLETGLAQGADKKAALTEQLT